MYLSTVLGGWIADRLLGMERTVFYGGVVVMAGHIALAIVPGLTGVGVGLVLVALGSGALKASASSLVGTLYEKGDARADGGFTLVLSGHQPRGVHRPADHRPAADPAGFHYGFGAAAIGMALGLAQYVVFRRNLGSTAAPCQTHCLAARSAVVGVVAVVVAVIVLGSNSAW